ncbi:NAD(P)H-dependent oxidoreductase [Palleronia sp. KMU-117]|uniref:NAD(P)H-dependent oxidoreductase n=1 Tax=Palleronia sp. KMU-117 TaxID=3434108 RepID=UPI003D74F71E
MRALIVYCHPRETSFTAAVRDVVLEKLHAAGAEVRLTDLYARGFDPRLTAHDLEIYEDEAANQLALRQDCADLKWCDTLIFVYPTWWYGLPAMLKGWLDRVMVPGLAFLMPKGPGETIGPGLTHITRLGVFTTCGASWWLTRLVGAPGRRTLLRGVGLLCAKGKRTAFAAHYLMDSSTPESRTKHLAKVARQMDKLIGRLPARATATA